MFTPRVRILVAVASVLFLAGVFHRTRSEESAPEAKPKEAKQEGSAHSSNPSGAPGGTNSEELSAVAPPPFTKGIFPCTGCHEDLEPNPTVRTLTKRHTDIVLKHDEKNRWCLDCHTAGNMDYLHLASGKLVDFKESYKLCGQCHGTKLRDWKAGEHGKRTGEWSGKKQYLLCVHCHNPHSPKFKPIEPLPPPVRPRDMR